VPGQETRSAFATGTHVFRRTLHEAKVRPLPNLGQLAGSEERKLLIVLGDTDVLDKASFDLDNWVRRGGAALIATDRDTTGGFLKPFDVEIRSNRVKVAEDSGAAYRGITACVFVEPTAPGRVIFHDLARVATNRAGFIPSYPGVLPGLAVFPRGKAHADGYILPVLRFAVGGPVGKGRILVLSDHSVFINLMLIQDDNDNLDFTYNCVEWLTESGKRTEALFYDEGRIRTEFDLPIKVPQAPTPPPPEQVIAALNKGMAGIEEEDGYNRALLQITGGTNVPLRGLALVLTVAASGFALARLFQARHRFEPGVAHLGSGLVHLVPSVEVLEQRHRAILRQGNFREVARLHARQAWDAILGTSGRAANEFSAETPPPVQLSGNWWRRRKLQRLARRLWRLAYGAEPVWISARRWRRVEGEVRVLRAAFAEGSLEIRL